MLWLLFFPLATAQSYTGGDLSPQPGPYGLPLETFAGNPVSNVSFSISGYNTSLPAGPAVATSNEVPGWSVTVTVSAGVPLSDSDSPSADKSQFFEATTIFLTQPAELGSGYNTSDWRVCAVVFTGGLGGENYNGDGSCASLLPSDCIAQVQVSSVATNTTGATPAA